MRRNLTVLLVVGSIAASMSGGLAPLVRGGTAAALYTVRDLGTLPGDYSSVAMGINAFGDVVGWSAGPTGTRAFIYTSQGGMTALPGLPGRPMTTARAISAGGVVVGTASSTLGDVGHAVRWQSGTVLDLGSLGTADVSEARGVNATGTIVGTASTDGGGVAGIHAFRYSDASGMVDLTPDSDKAHAEGINDAGQITGWRNGRAFRLTGDTFEDLGVPTGFAESFGVAINSSGQVAGHVISGSGNAERIFRYTDGAMVILGGLGEYNRAFGINTAGDVVGSGLPVAGFKQGFLYTDAAGMQGLNLLIDATSGWFILGATAINDAGQIAGWASGPAGQRAVLLTTGSPPPPTPPAAPSGLVGQALRGARVQLTWTDNADNELGFRIRRAVGNGDFAFLTNVGANVTTFTDTTVTAGTVYRYRVRAYNAAGVSPWSTKVRVRAKR